MELWRPNLTWVEYRGDDLYTPRLRDGFDPETGEPIYEADAFELCCLLEDKDTYDLDIPF